MANILIKGLPEILHRRLKAKANAHHRSMSGEIRAILEAALSPPYRVPKPPPPLDLGFPVTDDWINSAKRAGRA